MVKNRRLKPIYAILITISVIVFLSLSVFAMLFVSDNYQKMYKTSPNVNAVMDLEGYSLRDVGVDFTTSGKWEFFYNKWIVTDGLDAESDFLIDVPGRWTGKEIDGKKLKKNGYASYRFTILNPEAGSELVVKLQTLPIAYRTFINGKLTCISGTLSKTSKGGFARGLANELISYKVTEDSPLTVVLEISYNTSGGLFLSPWLHDNTRIELAAWNLTSLLIPVFALGMMVAFIIFNVILNFGLYRKENNRSFIFLLISFFLHLLTTKEVFWQIGKYFPASGWLSYALVFKLNFITAFIILLCFFINIIAQKSVMLKKPEIYVLSPFFALCVILFYAFSGTAYQIIMLGLGILGLCYIFYRILRTPQAKKRNKAFPAVTLILLMFTFLIEAFDNLGLIIYGLEPSVSIMTLLLITLVSIFSFIKVRGSSDDLLKASVLENEMHKVKHQALKAQIKPHFIFNALSSIQALYEKDNREGREALSKFASHLRQNIDSDNTDTISFAQEIKNIMNYVELENLRLDKKLTLILNIDYADFEVPPLSLQPLIENAIKYAGTQDKEDGYIRITSEQAVGEIIIEVSDNGKGFDTNLIRPNAVGLKNCRERFNYVLGAEMKITSALDEGTLISIKIPVSRESELK